VAPSRVSFISNLYCRLLLTDTTGLPQRPHQSNVVS
jgi:hypothetical protein